MSLINRKFQTQKYDQCHTLGFHVLNESNIFAKQIFLILKRMLFPTASQATETEITELSNYVLATTLQDQQLMIQQAQ